MPLQINTVISRYNYDYLEEMAELVADLGVVMWYIFLLVPTGRGQMELVLLQFNTRKCLNGYIN